MATALPDALAAKLEVTVHLDWLTYAHTREAGKQGLADYLPRCYGIDKELESDWANDTDHRFDLRTAALDAVQPYGAQSERDALMASLRLGWIENYHLYKLLELAVLDGHLPAGVYVLNVSW